MKPLVHISGLLAMITVVGHDLSVSTNTALQERVFGSLTGISADELDAAQYEWSNALSTLEDADELIVPLAILAIIEHDNHAVFGFYDEELLTACTDFCNEALPKLEIGEGKLTYAFVEKLMEE